MDRATQLKYLADAPPFVECSVPRVLAALPATACGLTYEPTRGNFFYCHVHGGPGGPVRQLVRVAAAGTRALPSAVVDLCPHARGDDDVYDGRGVLLVAATDGAIWVFSHSTGQGYKLWRFPPIDDISDVVPLTIFRENMGWTNMVAMPYGSVLLSHRGGSQPAPEPPLYGGGRIMLFTAVAPDGAVSQRNVYYDGGNYFHHNSPVLTGCDFSRDAAPQELMVACSTSRAWRSTRAELQLVTLPRWDAEPGASEVAGAPVRSSAQRHRIMHDERLNADLCSFRLLYCGRSSQPGVLGELFLTEFGRGVETRTLGHDGDGWYTYSTGGVVLSRVLEHDAALLARWDVPGWTEPEPRAREGKASDATSASSLQSVVGWTYVAEAGVALVHWRAPHGGDTRVSALLVRAVPWTRSWHAAYAPPSFRVIVRAVLTLSSCVAEESRGWSSLPLELLEIVLSLLWQANHSCGY